MSQYNRNKLTSIKDLRKLAESYGFDMDEDNDGQIVLYTGFTYNPNDATLLIESEPSEEEG